MQCPNLPTNRVFLQRLYYIYLIVLLAKGVPWEFLNKPSQAVAKIRGYPPQTEGKALLLKTTPIQLVAQQEVGLLPKEGLHAFVLVSLAQENALHAIRKKM